MRSCGKNNPICQRICVSFIRIISSFSESVSILFRFSWFTPVKTQTVYRFYMRAFYDENVHDTGTLVPVTFNCPYTIHIDYKKPSLDQM